MAAIDFVKAHPGQRDLLIRFYRLNWAPARDAVLVQGGIVDYRMLVSADTGSRWDVALETTYADSTMYAHREAAFRPVLQAQGTTRVDGMTRADIAEIVESRLVTVSRP